MTMHNKEINMNITFPVAHDCGIIQFIIMSYTYDILNMNDCHYIFLIYMFYYICVIFPYMGRLT